MVALLGTNNNLLDVRTGARGSYGQPAVNIVHRCRLTGQPGEGITNLDDA